MSDCFGVLYQTLQNGNSAFEVEDCLLIGGMCMCAIQLNHKES